MQFLFSNRQVVPNLIPVVGSEDAFNELKLEEVLKADVEEDGEDEEVPRLPVEWSIQIALSKGLTGACKACERCCLLVALH